MEILYFTATAVILYLVADLILLRMERTRGQPFKQRNLVFFAILLGLSLATFAFIRNLAG